jgi:hypothetical protein
MCAERRTGAGLPAATGPRAARRRRDGAAVSSIGRTGIDVGAVLALNAANEVETSPLDAAGLRLLCEQAFHVGLVERGRAALLIAFDQDAGHASQNFLWFKARYCRFVYVARVIVAATARGRSMATGRYRELFSLATADGHTLVTCEVDVQPRNPPRGPSTPPGASPRSAAARVATRRRASATSRGRCRPPRRKPGTGRNDVHRRIDARSGRAGRAIRRSACALRRCKLARLMMLTPHRFHSPAAALCRAIGADVAGERA